MRIGIDGQASIGRKTGIGCYAAELLAALGRVGPEHEYVQLSMHREVQMRTDRRLWWQQIGLPRQALSARVDLLHVTGFDAPLRKPCPVVLTVHDLIGSLFPGNFPLVARFYWARWLPASIRFADRVICVSQNTKADVLRFTRVAENRIRVIYPGVGPAFRPVRDPVVLQAVLRRYGLPRPYVLLVGTIEPRKGLGHLLSAYKRLSDEVPHHLVLAGQLGWHTEPLLDQIRILGLQEKVHFLDYVPDADLPALYSGADLFVFPSCYEGFGLPPLEALACQTPVVSSDAASLPEVVGQAALLFRSGDEEALAASMRRALTDQVLRERLKIDGLERARRFSWDETARQVLSIYRELFSNLC